MTRKDFELIAATLKEARADFNNRDDAQLLAIVAIRFANRLAATNPGFDRARFLKACGEEA